ncbi:hypothetical protein WN55_05881 [Dufourea novaeangliae]|uniref:Ribosomal RNA methyltransferase FtsJ domain-containing protein n=1 Tax=Dufourea novaeangliae TaxID=178035 RepID=A0A154PP26_DUFNO|nr:hypothetical protein WN55_05881 [Dufourea novaeangliae]
MTDKLATRLTRSNWESIEKLSRVALPRKADLGAAYVSRGGFKMQQLHEADPGFFEDVKVVLDPCCGYGGFAEYYSSAMASKAPKAYVMSSLYEKGHRIPVGELRQVQRSNVDVILATSVEHSDKGNIKDPRCSARLKTICDKLGGIDLLIVDAGEYSHDGMKNKNFWYKKGKDNLSFLDAVVNLIESIKKGGKTCTSTLLSEWSDTVSAEKISKEREKLDDAIAKTMPSSELEALRDQASVGLIRYLLGYEKPVTTTAPRWDWLKWSGVDTNKTHAGVSDVIRVRTSQTKNSFRHRRECRINY